MRRKRIKPDSHDTWHHCFNRIAGTTMDLPFDEADKEQFIRLLERVQKLYTVKVFAFNVLDNHFHLLLQAPQEMPSEQETCERYKAFHDGKRIIYSGTPMCREWQARLRDVSWFMRHLQQLFTRWYNHTRSNVRRGPLWSGRFKNTILEHGRAVWRCLNYIECNALRAGLVSHPGDYRFGSFGRWMQSGRHPFQENIKQILLPMLGATIEVHNMDDLKVVMNNKFDRVIREERHVEPDEQDIILTLKRRVRYWTEGLVIGSELFVREVMSCVHDKNIAAGRRLTELKDEDNPGVFLCSWCSLRI